jgi:3-oxoacyl-[acyl-carrier protein] reductase
MAGRFDGQVAIVTGASTGLGPVLAAMFAAEGAKVVLAARRIELADAVAKNIGSAAIAVRADVTVEADVASMVDVALESFGQVDILVNNAAQPGVDLFIWEQTLENWNNTVAVDVTAAMLCSREVIRRSMLERKSGAIVSLSSTAGIPGMIRKSHYSTAKAALRTLTKVIALEGGPHGIRANCLVSGAIDTELLRNYAQRIADEKQIPVEEQWEATLNSTPLRTISTTEDIANSVLFLCSSQARTITGQSLVVDAGVQMLG